MNSQKILFIIYLVTLLGCNNNSNRLEGILVDNNKKPIIIGKIQFVLWKDGLHSEEVSSASTTTIDSSGKFYIDLTDVKHLDFVVESDGFFPFVKKGYVPNTFNKIEILLNNAEGSFLATSSLNSENPKLKIGLEREVLFNKASIKTIKTIKNAVLQNSFFVWLESDDEDFKEVFICTSSEGILPITSNEIKNSIYWESIYAPMNGYVTKYKITGAEIGFFLKTSTGYAKLILHNDIQSGTKPQNNGYIKFKYYFFDWIFNPVGNDLSVKNISSNNLLE